MTPTPPSPRLALLVLLLAALAAGCVTPVPHLLIPLPTPTSAAAAPPSELIPAGAATPCAPAPIVAPTPPPVSYSFGQLDPITGLHVTGQAQQIDPISYRLVITGAVDTPLSLTLDEIRCLPRVEVHCTLVCPATFSDTATWAGARLWQVLELAGLPDKVSSIKLYGADGYAAWAPVAMAQADDSLLAYEWAGEPLPILHGFPLRGVFPNAPGSMWVKWLVKVEVR